MSILSPEEREQVAEELKRFGTSLNLSDDQKQKLQGFLTDAREKVQEYKRANPNASAQDLLKEVAANRSALRERLEKFLNPDQLTKWDAEVAKAKEFLGQKMAASA
jgi:predicted transcriptional regulator